jgi:hypothetical protein
VTKNNNENSFSSSPALCVKEPMTINREQQTTTIIPTIDPTLIATIHANKGAIDTIRGQIIELRHDVDHLRKQININRKRSTGNNTNPTVSVANQTTPPDLPTSSPGLVNNNHRVTKPKANVSSNNNNANTSSFSHHHHHHHHVEQPGATGRSSVCIII